jgi:lysophospholipase L1-like esterase
MIHKLALFSISCIVSIVICIIVAETALAVWQPPYIRLRGTDVLLTRNKTIENSYNFNSEKLRNHITIRKNSLGFRGPEPPVDFANHLTIVAVGGSTTECIFITEGKTWTDVLNTKLQARTPNAWVNNAGIDGHSTHGHRALLEQYIGKIRPNYVLFFVGINDMASDRENLYDRMQITTISPNNNGVWQVVKNRSMILSYIQYIQSKKGSHELTAMTNWIVDYRVLGNNTDHQPLSAADIRAHKEKSSAYGSRLRSLVAATRGYAINPILVTQPAVYGFGVDEENGVDLGNMIGRRGIKNRKRQMGAAGDV